MFQECCKSWSWVARWSWEVGRSGRTTQNQRQIHPTQTAPFFGWDNFCGQKCFLSFCFEGWCGWSWNLGWGCPREVEQTGVGGRREGGWNGRRRTRPAVPLLLAGPNLALLPTQSHPRSIANINYTLHYPSEPKTQPPKMLQNVNPSEITFWFPSGPTGWCLGVKHNSSSCQEWTVSLCRRNSKDF